MSGVGLGTTAIEITRNRFSDLAGGAIMVGGVTPDAHHPPRSGNGLCATSSSATTSSSNVSQNYREQAAILVTYATGAGDHEQRHLRRARMTESMSAGAGAPTIRAAAPLIARPSRGYYDQPGNLTYDTPTILRDTRRHSATEYTMSKQWFPDGGAIYHLSADPGALIAENYICDVPGGIALYLDEGSRYVTVRNNVVENVGVWLNVNSQDYLLPKRTAIDNSASGNWYNSGRLTGSWTKYLNNILLGNIAVKGDKWPAAARDVIERSGIRAEQPKP